MFQDYLEFCEYIKTMVLNANSILSIIMNTFQDLGKENLIVLYKSSVRPTLEYCCTTWSPNLIMYHKEIEKKSKEELPNWLNQLQIYHVVID